MPIYFNFKHVRRSRRYLYTNIDYVKSGALLAIGLVNCGIRNECDPALALLSEYVSSSSQTLRIGAVLGLGLAYAGSRRKDVSELLYGALANEQSKICFKRLFFMGWRNFILRENRR